MKLALSVSVAHNRTIFERGRTCVHDGLVLCKKYVSFYDYFGGVIVRQVINLVATAEPAESGTSRNMVLRTIGDISV